MSQSSSQRQHPAAAAACLVRKLVASHAQQDDVVAAVALQADGHGSAVAPCFFRGSSRFRVGARAGWVTCAGGPACPAPVHRSQSTPAAAPTWDHLEPQVVPLLAARHAPVALLHCRRRARSGGTVWLAREVGRQAGGDAGRGAGGGAGPQPAGRRAQLSPTAAPRACVKGRGSRLLVAQGVLKGEADRQGLALGRHALRQPLPEIPFELLAVCVGREN